MTVNIFAIILGLLLWQFGPDLENALNGTVPQWVFWLVLVILFVFVHVQVLLSYYRRRSKFIRTMRTLLHNQKEAMECAKQSAYAVARLDGVYEQLMDWGVLPPAHLTLAGGRRPWVEKSLAQQLDLRGAHIHVRARLIGMSDKDVTTASGEVHEADIILDATGSMTGFGRPGEVNLIREKEGHPTWYGGIVSRSTFPPSRMVADRSDQSQEIWSEEPLSDDVSWIERCQGEFPESHLSMAGSVADGIALAKSIQMVE